MSLEREYTGPAAAALLMGRDWFSSMPAINGAGGLLHGLIYLPSMLLCPDPGMQYKLFLLTNSVIYSFIPVIAYRLSVHLGVSKISLRVLAAAVCGIFPTLMIHAHLLLPDGFSSVMIWLIMLFVLRDESGRGKLRRGYVSAAAAIFTAAAYYFSPSCFVLFPAVLITLLLMKKLTGRDSIYISVYTVVYLLLFAADFVITFILDFSVPGGANGGLYGTVISSFSAILSDPAGFVSLLAGRLYHLSVASWGLVPASCALGMYALFNCLRRKKSPEKMYTGVYAAAGMLCTLMIILLTLGDAFISMSAYPDGGATVISSSVSAFTAAPAVFMLFVHLIEYRISYGRLMMSIAVTGGVSAVLAAALCMFSTAVFSDPVSVVCGDISALRIGTPAYEPFTEDSIIYPVCLILTAYAVMTSVVCCAKKYAGSIVTCICTGLVAYSAIYISAAVIPRTAELTAQSAELSAAVSEYIENGSRDDSRPVVAVYKTSEMLAMNLQYFNQNCEVMYISDESLIPDDCFVVSERSVGSDGLSVLVGRENGINIYVRGAETLLYNSSEEGEDISQPPQLTPPSESRV